MSSPDLQQLAPALFRLRIPTGPAHPLNCFLWLGEDGVTLVDTGWPDSADLIAAALAALGRDRAVLDELAQQLQWPTQYERVVAAARGIYRGQPAGVPTWAGYRSSERLDIAFPPWWAG